jgi:hypothetical protein
MFTWFVYTVIFLSSCQPGDGSSGYVKHIDQSPISPHDSTYSATAPRRILTYVFYFNKEPNGGALRVHKPAVAVHVPYQLSNASGHQFANGDGVVETDSYIDVTPKFGRVVIFRR